jgi:hypothetical protein
MLWLTTTISSFIRSPISKKVDIAIYLIYKKSRPVIPKEVVNIYDLGYLRVEKDFPEQIISLSYRRRKK